MATPLTDQAIAKIKELIISGDFTPGSKLPREQDLAKQLGLSRNSLREAVRALTLVGVLDARVGDGTYVTSLDSDLLLTGMGFVGDLLAGPTLLEVHQVRRILEPVATGLAATRLTEEEFEALERCLDLMDDAETTQAFIDADAEFHRVIVAGGRQRHARLAHPESLERDDARADVAHHRRGGRGRGTKQRHRDIYLALRAGDAERASAADRLHLAEGEEWLRHVLSAGDAGPGRRAAPGNGKGASREGRLLRGRRPVHARRREPRAAEEGEVRLTVAYCGICGTDLHIAHGAMDHGSTSPQVIGHEMSGTVAAARRRGRRLRGRRRGRRAAARRARRDARRQGLSHISRNLKFLGIDTPGAFQASWTVPAFTLHRLPDGSRPEASPR